MYCCDEGSAWPQPPAPAPVRSAVRLLGGGGRLRRRLPGWVGEEVASTVGVGVGSTRAGRTRGTERDELGGRGVRAGRPLPVGEGSVAQHQPPRSTRRDQQPPGQDRQQPEHAGRACAVRSGPAGPRAGSSCASHHGGVRRPRRRGRPGRQVLAHAAHRPRSRGIRGHRVSRAGPPASPHRAASEASSWTMRYIAARTLSVVSYGGLPVSAWYSVAPSDQTSLASVAGLPAATSGARYAGEPVTMPGRRDRSSHGRGDAEVGQLGGAVGGDQDVGRLDVAVHDAGRVRARRVPRPPGASSLRRRRREAAVLVDERRRSVPATCSMTSHCSSPSVTKSKTATTWGWLSLAASLASRCGAHQAGCVATGEVPDPLDGDLATEHLVDGQPHRAHAAAGRSGAAGRSARPRDRVWLDHLGSVPDAAKGDAVPTLRDTCESVSSTSDCGAPGASRTRDLSLRRRLLYPLSYWGGAGRAAARCHILSGPPASSAVTPVSTYPGRSYPRSPGTRAFGR